MFHLFWKRIIGKDSILIKQIELLTQENINLDKINDAFLRERNKNNIQLRYTELNNNQEKLNLFKKIVEQKQRIIYLQDMLIKTQEKIIKEE